MVNHEKDDEAVWLKAHEYAFGTLSASDAAEFEAHLATGCAACAGELERARELEGSLALSVAPLAPPPAIRERLMARVKTAVDSTAVQRWRTWGKEGTNPDHILIRAGDGGWERTAIDGIEVRRLSVDAKNDRVSMVIRMAPGTRYPSHRHGGREECFVLEGDLRHEQQVMHAGDYEVVEGGTLHGWQWTENGCVLLIHSSMHDELLPT